MVSPSGLHINKPLLCAVCGGVIALLCVYKLWWSDSTLMSFSAFNFGLAATPSEKDKSLLATVDIKVGQLPNPPALTQSDIDRLKKDEFSSAYFKNFTIADKPVSVFLHQTVPSKTPSLNVLLLHGAAFSSQNWVDINTMYHLAHWGHRAIALDLPGKGKTPEIDPSIKKEEFLSACIDQLQIGDLVLVAPSMSGGYALPYLFKEPAMSTKKAKGFIPIAPVLTETFEQNYKSSQLPTLIVYGEKDASLGLKSLKFLSLLPKHQIAKIPGAGHAVYMDQSEAWHRVLYYWLHNLSQSLHH